MKLGKIYSRLKREANAAEISITFSNKNDGTTLPAPHRKLKMLMLLKLVGKVNKAAYKRELNKYITRKR